MSQKESHPLFIAALLIVGAVAVVILANDLWMHFT